MFSVKVLPRYKVPSAYAVMAKAIGTCDSYSKVYPRDKYLSVKLKWMERRCWDYQSKLLCAVPMLFLRPVHSVTLN
jgi:hypothetical protein